MNTALATAWSPDRQDAVPMSDLRRTALAPWYLLLHIGATILVAGVCATFAARVEPSPFTASVMFTLSVAWILFSWIRVTGTIASPYWLFVVVASLFNGGQAFLEAVGLNTNGVLGGRFSDATTSATILFSNLSLMLLHLGALSRRIRGAPNSPPFDPPQLERGTIRLGLLLVAIAVVPTFLQLREGLTTVLEGGYFALYQREIKTNVGAWQALFSQFMLPGAFLLAAASKHRQAMRYVSLVILMIFAGSYLFMGYRGAAGAAMVAYAWIWHTRIAKLPVAVSIATGVLIVFGVFPMIRVHRSAAGEQRLSWNAFLATLDNYDNPAVASVSEMGGSMSTTAYTMDLVPSDRDFDYGKSYLYALLAVVPNIFGTPLHPSIARGTASEWLVRTTSYHTAVRRGGLGFSFIAESYLNFGWLGPLLIMIPLGYVYVAAESYALRGAAQTALMGVVLFFSLIFARAESASISRSIVWCGLMPLAVLSILIPKEAPEYLVGSDTDEGIPLDA